MSSSQQGFSAIAEENAKVLILGSMPSEKSLEKHQYYAHPRNAFWKIIEKLFAIPFENQYQDRLKALTKQQIALWDVIQSCEREGSLDSSIKNHSVISNDFASFFQQYSKIEHVFFNGSRAEKEYKQRVLTTLPLKFQKTPTTRLPSTSPAMATLNFEQKLAAWKALKDKLTESKIKTSSFV